MFNQKWRQHWGLSEDPFACEDADKDVVLAAVDSSAVHSGFDRVFGNPRVPAPGIVFGEKGSGKSGLRLMMRRRIAEHNERHPDERLFLVEYVDFDRPIEHFRTALGGKGRSADDVLARWTISDHLDALLALGVTGLCDRCLDDAEAVKVRGLPRKQKQDLLLLTALYHDSPRRTTAETLRALRSRLSAPSVRTPLRFALALVVTALGLGAALVPHLETWEVERVQLFYGAGATIVLLAWLWFFADAWRVRRRAGQAVRSLRTHAGDPRPLAEVLAGLRPKDRAEFGLPHGTDDGSRYDLLERFLSLLEALSYTGAYVLVDRVDEPSLLSGSDERMRRFVERILDIKLLQYPRLALKLFLPIEMESLYRSASSEELKRMRLDKSNLIPELKWTGEELFEIADQRLQACTDDDSRVDGLQELFEEGFDPRHLRETLTALGTPRYAFGFLSAAFQEYVRELPGELEPDDPRWRLPRAHFDVVRGAWIDRAGHLRRSLN